MNLKKHSLIIIAIVFVSFVFLTLYPTKYISIDENQYLANTYRLLTDTMQVECNTISEYPGFHYAPNNLCVSKYSLGSSFLLFPVVFIGEQYAFVIVFAAFILSGIFFYWIMEELKINKFFIILYFFYPPFVYFSRTLFSEVFSLLFINIFLYIFLTNKNNSRTKDIITGGVIGIATFVRYTNLLIFAAFLGTYLIKYRDVSKVLHIALGAIPFGIIIMIANKILYGGIFSTGYSMNNEDVFSISNLSSFPKYILLLAIMYPFMIILSFLIQHKFKMLFLIPSILTITLYSLYPYSFFEGSVTDLVIAGRFLIPIVPLLMLCYFYFLNEKLNRSVRIFITLALTISTLLVANFHQSYLNSSEVTWKSPSEHYLPDKN